MSKNNPAKRGKAKVKMYNGKEVVPVLYVGSRIGHGRYIAVKEKNGQLIKDSAGRPLTWDSV